MFGLDQKGVFTKYGISLFHCTTKEKSVIPPWKKKLTSMSELDPLNLCMAWNLTSQ